MDKVIDSPENVSITMRYSEDCRYIFIMNFNNSQQKVDIPFDYDILSGKFDNGCIEPYAIVVLKNML